MKHRGHGNAANNESSVMENIVTDSFDNNINDDFGMKHEYIFVHHHKYMTRTTLARMFLLRVELAAATFSIHSHGKHG